MGTPSLRRMRRIWAAMALASLGWGTAGVATRFALEHDVTPYRLASYRATFAVVAVVAMLAVRRRGIPRDPVTWRVGLVMGTTNLAAPIILGTLALQYAGAGFVGLTTALIPLVTAAAAHLAPLDERLTPLKTVGLLLGFAGVAVLVLSGDTGLAEGGRPVAAGVLSLAAVVSISFGGLYAKYHAGRYEPLDVTGLQHGIGAALLVVATLVVEGGPRLESGAAWAALVYLAVMSSFVAMMLYYWMLRTVSATYAALSGYIVPPIAIVAGVLVLGEEVQAGIVAGGLLILAGVILADRAERRPAPATAAPSV